MRTMLSRPEAALFVLVFSAYAYFYQAGGWNQNSHKMRPFLVIHEPNGQTGRDAKSIVFEIRKGSAPAAQDKGSC